MTLKLGTQTNSLTNHLYSRMTKGQPTPEVGMGATLLAWTDRYGATIVGVQSYRKRLLLTVQEDRAKRTDTNGMSESQTYEFTSNPNGAQYMFRQTATGGWEEVRFNPETKRYAKTGGYGLRIGERNEYRDFSF